jgi:hypothetical protein
MWLTAKANDASAMIRNKQANAKRTRANQLKSFSDTAGPYAIVRAPARP